MPKQALIVIDLQNDYFPGGKFPLWNADETLEHIENAIFEAHEKGIPVILVQHVADPNKGIAPFFNLGTVGVELHPRILAAAPEAIVITKSAADSFHNTNLDAELFKLGIDQLLICGMMTQNCVTHTALSRVADKYDVAILAECCTTVDQMIHRIALNALTTRFTIRQ